MKGDFLLFFGLWEGATEMYSLFYLNKYLDFVVAFQELEIFHLIFGDFCGFKVLTEIKEMACSFG